MKRQSFTSSLLVIFTFCTLPLISQVTEPHPVTDTEEIFKIVEEMPMFPGCDNIRNPKGKKQCADNKMLQYFYKNLKYPAQARQYGIEGTQVISFVVDKSGKLRDIKMKRGIGFGGEKSALDLMAKMQDEIIWMPGKQRGRAVSVQYTLPIKYKLEHPRDNYIQSDEFLEVYTGKFIHNEIEISAELFQKLHFDSSEVDLVETSERALDQYNIKAPNGLIVVKDKLSPNMSNR